MLLEDVHSDEPVALAAGGIAAAAVKLQIAAADARVNEPAYPICARVFARGSPKKIRLCPWLVITPHESTSQPRARLIAETLKLPIYNSKQDAQSSARTPCAIIKHITDWMLRLKVVGRTTGNSALHAVSRIGHEEQCRLSCLLPPSQAHGTEVQV